METINQNRKKCDPVFIPPFKGVGSWQTVTTFVTRPRVAPQLLTDPILAYVKAHCFRYDSESYVFIGKMFRQLPDTSKLSKAIKLLYDFYCTDLIRLGFTYQSRRSSDKRQLFNSLFSDHTSAFDLPDGDSSLPEMFCESLHLIQLPSLEPDPESKQLELNTKAISSSFPKSLISSNLLQMTSLAS